MISSKAITSLCCLLLCGSFSVSADETTDTSPDTSTEMTSGKSSEQKNAPKEGWFYGGLASYGVSPYRDHKNTSTVFPAIGYKSEKFSLTGPRASYQFWKQSSMKANVTVQYQSFGYDTKDSDYLSGMRNRSGSLFAGLSASTKMGRWTHEVSYQQDIQGRSEGGNLQLGTSYFHNIGPLFITPKLTLDYLNSNFTQYYYGVEASESRADRSAYSPSDAWNPSASLTFATPILFGGFTRLTITNHWLDDTLSDSPIIEDKHYWKASLMFTRFF